MVLTGSVIRDLRQREFLRVTCAYAILIFALSSIVTLVFWSVLPAEHRVNESSDFFHSYDPVARNILVGNGIRYDNGMPAISYPPGYPLILAATYSLAGTFGIPESCALQMLSLLCMAISAILLYLISCRVWGNPLAIIPPLLWITYPLSLWLTKQPNSESPFLLFLFGSFFLFLLSLSSLSGIHVATSLSLFVGILTGFAMLIRPIALGLGVVYASLVWLPGRHITVMRKLFLTVAILVGNVVTILPWELWAYQQTSEVVLLSTAGPRALKDGLTFTVREKGFRQGAWIPKNVKKLMYDINLQYDELRSTKDVLSLIVSELQNRPITVCNLFLIKAIRSWYGTDSQRHEPAILILQTAYLLPILITLIVNIKYGGIVWDATAYIWLIAGYFWSMNILSTTLVRYTVPVMGLLFMTVPGLSYIFRRGINSRIE